MKSGLISDLNRGMDVIERALEMQRRCSKVGFDWDEPSGARDKLVEEVGELDEAMAGNEKDKVFWETGDLLLACVNLSRLLDVDPVEALHAALDRFQVRFAFIEKELSARGLRPEEVDLMTLEDLWQKSK